MVCSNEDDLQNVVHRQNVTLYVYTDPRRGPIGYGARGDVFAGNFYPEGVGRCNPAGLVAVKVLRGPYPGTPKAEKVRFTFPQSWHAD